MIDIVPALPSLRRFAHKLLRHDQQGIDDLVQATALRALERQHQFHAGTDLTAWLMSIMRSIHVNGVSASIRRRELEALIVCPAHAPDDPAIGLVVRDVARAFRTLSPEFREAVIAMRVQGLDCHAAGIELGVPSGTVKSRDGRARAILREAAL